MGRIGGIVYLRKDGKLITLGDGDLSFNLGGIKREAVLSSSGVAGFSGKFQVPFIEGEMLHTKDLDIKEMLDTEDATISAELYNGKTFILHEAFFVGEGDVSSDGKFKFRFESAKEGELIDA